MLNRIGFNNFSQTQRNTLSFGISKEQLTEILDQNPELTIQMHRSAGNFAGVLKHPNEKGTSLVNVDIEDTDGSRLNSFGYGDNLEQVYSSIANKINEGDKLTAQGKNIHTVA